VDPTVPLEEERYTRRPIGDGQRAMGEAARREERSQSTDQRFEAKQVPAMMRRPRRGPGRPRCSPALGNDGQRASAASAIAHNHDYGAGLSPSVEKMDLSVWLWA